MFGAPRWSHGPMVRLVGALYEKPAGKSQKWVNRIFSHQFLVWKIYSQSIFFVDKLPPSSSVATFHRISFLKQQQQQTPRLFLFGGPAFWWKRPPLNIKNPNQLVISSVFFSSPHPLKKIDQTNPSKNSISTTESSPMRFAFPCWRSWNAELVPCSAMLRSIIKALDHEKLEDNEALHEATSQRLGEDGVDGCHPEMTLKNLDFKTWAFKKWPTRKSEVGTTEILKNAFYLNFWIDALHIKRVYLIYISRNFTFKPLKHTFHVRGKTHCLSWKWKSFLPNGGFNGDLLW